MTCWFRSHEALVLSGAWPSLATIVKSHAQHSRLSQLELLSALPARLQHVSTNCIALPLTLVISRSAAQVRLTRSSSCASFSVGSASWRLRMLHLDHATPPQLD